MNARGFDEPTDVPFQSGPRADRRPPCKRAYRTSTKTLVALTVPSPVGVNVPLAVSLSLLLLLRRRLPASVSLILIRLVPAAVKDARPDATSIGFTLFLFASFAPGGSSYQSMTAVPASNASNLIVNPLTLSSAGILAALPAGVSSFLRRAAI